VASKFARFESSCLVWGEYCKKMCKTFINDLDELEPNQRLRMEWAKLDHIVIVAAIIGGIVDRVRSVMCVLYTIYCSFFPHATIKCIHILQMWRYFSGKVENVYTICSKFIQETIQQIISSESTQFCLRYYRIHFDLFFPRHIV